MKCDHASGVDQSGECAVYVQLTHASKSSHWTPAPALPVFAVAGLVQVTQQECSHRHLPGCEELGVAWWNSLR